IQNQSAQQQKELTPDEQQKATQTIQEILKIAPYIQNGITLVNGKLTLFDVAKSYGISFAQQKVAQKSPEIGALFSLGTAVQGVYAAAVPSENPAGQVIFDSINNIFLIAAWDGNNFYYNFRLKDVRSHDLSFLFKEGEIYLNNMQISKDFGDDFIRFNFFDNSNLDLNSDLFVNLDGYLQLDKNNANIEYADLKSKKDNNELNFNHVNGIPFKIALSRNGIIQYSSQDNSLITDRSKIALNKNNYELSFDNAKINTDSEVLIETSSSITPGNKILNSEENYKIEVLLNNNLETEFNLIRLNQNSIINVKSNNKILNINPKSNMKITINDGITNSKFKSNNLQTEFNSKNIILNNNKNKVLISTLQEELNDFNSLISSSQERITYKIFEYIKNA
ncbi:MAG: hypothetical protein AABY07_03540, partial [Nanoarchaeota archaeon]